MGAMLVLPLLVRLFWPRPASEEHDRVEGTQTTLLHPMLGHLQSAFESRQPRQPLSARLHNWLLYLLWIALVVALMRPQWLEPHTESRTAGYDLMLAVDTSRSMTALDFTLDEKQVSRMQVVKGVVSRFIQERRGDRVGLVIFGSRAYVLSPLTFDLDAVDKLLNELVPAIAGPATAMGDAMGLGVKKLRERPEGSRVLILVTDGKNEGGIIPPLKAAQLAKEEDIKIYTIGVGSNERRVRMLDAQMRNYIWAEGLAFDEETLQEIARVTGGAYFRATDTEALEKIYQRIGELEKTEAESRTLFIPRPLYPWPLGFALLCLLMLGLYPEGRARRLRGGGYA
jgi:Ca-activated chloride channel family protein